MAKKPEPKATEDFIINYSEVQPKVPGLKLNIGCGDTHMDGFINVDLYNKSADALWNAKSLPLNDNSVSLILSYQTIEHFNHEEVPSILKEWFRVLKPKGEVHLNTPDIITSCELVVKNPDRIWYLSRIFGNQSHEGQYHRWGYSMSELSNLFGMTGFLSVTTADYINVDGTRFIYLKAIK